MYDFDAAIPEERPGYALRSEGYNFPEMPISGVRMSAGRFVRTERVIARAGLDHVLLSIPSVQVHRRPPRCKLALSTGQNLCDEVFGQTYHQGFRLTHMKVAPLCAKCAGSSAAIMSP